MLPCNSSTQRKIEEHHVKVPQALRLQ